MNRCAGFIECSTLGCSCNEQREGEDGPVCEVCGEPAMRGYRTCAVCHIAVDDGSDVLPVAV